MADVKIRITGDASGLQNAVNQSNQSISSLSASASTAMKSIASVMGPLTSILGSGAIVASLISTQREFDKINTGLVTVTGSVSKAAEAFQLLTGFAASTPFSLQEVSNAFVKLKTLGLDPTESALRSYGNTASAMGKSLNQMVEAVADAATGEFERLKEFGIKANKEGDNVKLTFKGITTTVKNSANEIQGYLLNLGNTDFAGAMERQANTLDGAISNLGDSWSQLMLTISQSGPNDSLTEGVRAASTALTDLSDIIKEMSKSSAEMGDSFNLFVSIAAGSKVVFQTIAILATDVMFVFKGIGREIGAWAAQIAALGSGDLAQFRAISEMVKADGERARLELEKIQRNILNPLKQLSGAGILDARDLRLLNESRAPDAPGGASSGSIKSKRALITDADRLALQQLEAALKAAKKNEDDWREGIEKANRALSDNIISLNDKAIAAETEAENYGKTKSQIEDTTIARLEEQRRIADGFDGQETVVANLDKEIAARKRLRAGLQAVEGLDDAKRISEDNASAAKKAEEDWQRTWDQLGQSLTDEIMRGGKNAGQLLKDYFRTLVLRPIIQSTVQMGMSALGLGGSSGGGSTAVVGGSWNMSPMSLGWSNFASSNAGVSMGLSTPINGPGTIGGTELTQWGQYGADFSSAVDSYGGYVNAFAQAANGNWGAAAGSAIGQSMGGPLGAFIGNTIGSAVDSMFGGESRQGGVSYLYGSATGDGTGIYNDYGTSGITAKFGSSGGPIQGIQELTGQTVAGINTLFRTLGSSATLAGFQAGAETSGNGRGGVFSGGTLSTGVRFGEAALGSNYSGGKYESTSSRDGDAAAIARNFGDDMLQVTIQALQAATDLPASISEYLQGIDAESLTGEAAAAIIQSVSAVAAFGSAVEKMPFENLRDLSFETTTALFTAAGGMDALGVKLGSYYENFYSQSERTAQATANLNAGFDDLGIAMPATKAEFRALVDGLDLTTESGRRAYNGLLTLSSGFSSFVDSTMQAAGISGDSISTLIRDGMLGRMSKEDVGGQLAGMVVDGVYNSIAGTFAQQITDIFVNGLVQPVIMAAATGASVTDIVAGIAIDDMVATATTAAEALGEIFNNPEFKAAIRQIGVNVADIVASIVPDTPYVPPKSQSVSSTAWSQDATTNQWASPATTAAEAAYDPTADRLAWQERLDVLTGASTQRQIDMLRDLASTTDAATQALINQVYAQEDLATAAEIAANVARTLADWQGKLLSLTDPAGQRGRDLQRDLASTTDAATQALIAQVYAQQDLADAAKIAADALAKAEEDRAQAADMLTGLGSERDSLLRTELANSLAEIAQQADDYKKSLTDLGQATAENVAAVDLWADAMSRSVLAAESMKAMQVIQQEIDGWSQLSDTVSGSMQDVRSQMAGFDSIAYWDGQSSNASAALAGATNYEDRAAAVETLRGSIMEGYSARLAAINSGLETSLTAVDERARIAEESARKQFDAEEENRSKAVQAANELNAAYRSIGEYAADLLRTDLSPLSGSAQLAYNRQQYSASFSKGSAGDIESLQALPGLADAFLNTAKDQAATAADYARTFSGTRAQLAALGNRAGADIEYEQREFMFASQAYDAEKIALQATANANIKALQDSTVALLGDLNTQIGTYLAANQELLRDEAVVYATLTDGIIDTNDTLASVDANIAASVRDAQAAQQAFSEIWAGITAQNESLVAEVRALRADLASQNSAIARNTATTVKLLDQVTTGGTAIITTPA
jgi:hypothetical protein